MGDDYIPTGYYFRDDLDGGRLVKKLEPPEPPCSEGRRAHADRVRDIDRMLMEGKVGGICIDDTPEHRAWYLHEIAKYPRLSVVFQGVLREGIYIIKVRQGPQLN